MDIDEIQRRRFNQRIYFCGNPEIAKAQMACLDKLFMYNSLKPSEQAQKQDLLKEMFAEIGEGCYIETPFHSNWGGQHVHFGNYVYANFNLTLVDDDHIYVGDRVMFGPNVILATATHPVDPDLRKNRAQYNLSIHIADNVWIGAGVTVLPGVTIGENSVIGAGSVVTRDIPANVVAVGNPCRVMREMSEKDKKYYYRDLEVDVAEYLLTR